ncbi:MAG TPA: DMT family transporter [Rhizomicrobium sp.]|jgi:transporter family-2 protein|nr:DMT family transporter [Rhizomicrobium sp.]
MTNPTESLLLSSLMFATGVGIPVMAALNARLGTQLGSPWAAGFLLFVLGAGICGIAMLWLGPPQKGWFVAPAFYYMGGVLVAFYVLSVTWSAPRIGVANAIFFVLVGQIVAAALIDQFGLFGALKSTLTWPRLLGIALMLVGTFLARRVA